MYSGTMNGDGAFQKPMTNGHVNNELLEHLVNNSERISRWMAQMYGDKRRNIESECGYVETGQISAWDYQRLWDRDPVAGRVVNVFPMESWQQPPQLIEDEDVENITDFEAAWTEVGKNITTEGLDGWYRDDQVNSLWSYLERADIHSGIGSYGVMLLGIDDGRDLREPADLNAKSGRKLNFIRILSECEARVSQFETDERSTRYGKPKMYSVLTGLPTLGSNGEYVGATTGVTQTQTKEVHWSRVVHVVDNPYGSEVGGIPRMQQPYNRLYDLHKMYGGSTEMYWQGAFPGISFETHPQLGGDVQIDQTAMRSQLVNYTQGLQRYLTMAGMTAKTLSPTVVDPSANIDKLIEAICILTGIPKRIFMGSERGELASTTDLKSWYNRCRHRQTSYVTPFLIARFIDRLILLGVLPIPSKGYGISWPDLAAASDLEKAQIAVQRTTAMSSYVMGGLYQLIAPKDFMTRVIGYDETEANQILEDTQDNMEQMQEANLEQRTAPPEPNDNGNPVGNEELEEGSTRYGEIEWDEDDEYTDDEREQLEYKGFTYVGNRLNNTWSDKAREASAEARKAKSKYLSEAATEAGATANRIDTHKAHTEASHWYALATEAVKDVSSLDPKANVLFRKYTYHKDQADKIKSGYGSNKERQATATRKAKLATQEANSTKNPLKAAKLHAVAAKANTEAGNTEQAKVHSDTARKLSERVVKADSTNQRQAKLDTVASKATKLADKASSDVKAGIAVSSGPTRTGGRAFGKLAITPEGTINGHKAAAKLHTKAAEAHEAAGNTEAATYHKERAKQHKDQARVNNAKHQYWPTDMIDSVNAGIHYDDLVWDENGKIVNTWSDEAREKSAEARRLRKEIKEHKLSMKERGIKISSMMNRHPSMEAARANEKLFALKLDLEKVATKPDKSKGNTPADVNTFLNDVGITKGDYLDFGPQTKQFVLDKYNQKYKTKITVEELDSLISGVSNSNPGHKGRPGKRGGSSKSKLPLNENPFPHLGSPTDVFDEHPINSKQIPISNVVATQSDLDKQYIEKLSKQKGTYENPSVVEYKGKFYITDGHHRVVAALNRGDTHIEADVSKVENTKHQYWSDDLIDAVNNEDPSLLVENAKFSSTQLTVTQPEVLVAVKLLQEMISPSDVVELETESHITVRYGLHTQDADEVAKWITNSGPILVKLGRLSVFSSNPEYDVLKIEVESNPLHKLNDQLGLLDNTSTQPEYNPHMTIAYLRKGTGADYARELPNNLFGTRLLFHSLTFSNVDKQNTGLPLSSSL